MLADKKSREDYARFKKLYNTYAPKVYGFISKYAETKELSEQYMEKVFHQVWRDINYFNGNAEKKLMHIVLLVCKPVLKLKSNKNSNTYSSIS